AEIMNMIVVRYAVSFPKNSVLSVTFSVATSCGRRSGSSWRRPHDVATEKVTDRRHHEQHIVDLRLGVELPAEAGRAVQRKSGNAQEAVHPAEPVPVAHDELEDHGHDERDDREVDAGDVAVEEEVPERPREDDGQQDRQRVPEVALVEALHLAREQRDQIAAEAEVRRVPEVEDPGIAPQQIEAHGEDAEDQRLAEQLGVILARDRWEGEGDEDAGREEQAGRLRSHPPNSPRGRKRMMMMAMTRTAACAVVAEIR